MIRTVDVIAKKRDGGILSDEEISFIVNGAVTNEIPDYQLSAFLMAVYLNGMEENEIFSLTKHMSHSGKILDFSNISNKITDKHSTGGVGDKTTLIVVPTVAACGVKTVKLSGRGLGHTGGTVDKLESIPGFKTAINNDKLAEICKNCGCVVAMQSSDLAYCDKIFYALRDATSTVESIPLIASSIMSKKLASGADIIVLDVKYGSGAFMKTKEDAEKLAEIMVKIGRSAGKHTDAVTTCTNAPLGMYVGNNLEVYEAVTLLKGGNYDKKLFDLSVRLASKMIAPALSITENEAATLAENAIRSGNAYNKFIEMVRLQGGDCAVFDELDKFIETDKLYKAKLKADEDGILNCVNASTVGTASCVLGAGRIVKEQSIDPYAGIIFKCKFGEKIKKGEIVAELRSQKEETLLNGLDILRSAISYT